MEVCFVIVLFSVARVAQWNAPGAQNKYDETTHYHIDGLMPEGRNSIINAVE